MGNCVLQAVTYTSIIRGRTSGEMSKTSGSGVTNHPERTGNMQPKQTILVVDDDPRILRLLRVNLEKAGFVVSTASGGAAAIEQFDLEAPDAIVVDVTMPGMDGFTFTQRIREASNVPIIFLTALGEQSQKVHGLELGADDYVTKPFDPEELVARVRALLRRSNAAASGEAAGGHMVQAGDLVIDFLKHRVEYNGEQVKLTPTEYKLLQQLAQQAGKVIPHADLLSKVWGPEYRDETGYLWVYIRSLRQKLEPDPSNPQFIMSEPGFGYRFQVPKEVK
jgi:DNA-binding response OmpR family regulator